MTKYIKENNLNTDVCWAGNLNQNEMNWCYKNCSLFVMTSRVESFGMIAGEALAMGCLCISSSSPCLPEIFQDSALYYDKGDYVKLGEKILKIINYSKSKKKEMSLRSIKRSEDFSWDECVKRTINFLQQVC